MSGEVLPFNSKPLEERPSKAMQRADRRVVEEVRLAGRRADGAIALAGHIMERAADLDEHRRRLVERTGGELASMELNAMLLRIEANAVQTAARLQQGLFSDWKL